MPKPNHKYLKDIGIKPADMPWNWNNDDSRQKEWREERQTYGFDERDTWNLYYTMTLMTYERLKHYREIAPVEIDTPHLSHTYEMDGKNVPYGVIIDRILTGFENYLKAKDEGWLDTDTKVYDEWLECWTLFALIIRSLWW